MVSSRTTRSSKSNGGEKFQDNDYLPSSSSRRRSGSSNDANLSDSSSGTMHDALDVPRNVTPPKEWEVERVLSKQIKRDASVHYLLKWKNYKGEPTWEPNENCGCPKLIKEFEDDINRNSSGKDRLSVESKSSSSSETRKTRTKSSTRTSTSRR